MTPEIETRARKAFPFIVQKLIDAGQMPDPVDSAIALCKEIEVGTLQATLDAVKPAEDAKRQAQIDRHQAAIDRLRDEIGG